MATVKYSELEMAVEFVSGGDFIDAQAYISRETGRIYWVSDDDGLEEELPDDVGDPDRYVAVPGKRDLDLGKPLVLKFAARYLADDYEEVQRIFSRKGAYSRYKDLLQDRRKLEDWYEYEQAAVEKELMEWAEFEGFSVERDAIEPTE